MGYVFLMIANYFHDLAVAILAVNVVAIFVLGRYLDRRGAAPEFMPHLFKKLSRVTYISLAVVVAGGAVRAWFFMDFEYNPAVGQNTVAALAVKHIILVALTAFGLAGHLKYRKKYGRQ
jgi:hypothetical protein